MLTVTRDVVLPTTITGSYPKPHWYTENLDGRPFKLAMGDTKYREQYLDAVAAIIGEQSTAGLDIVSDGDTRFDLVVGGKSWFFYPLERLGGLSGRRDHAPGWSGGAYGIRPGHILWEVQEAYQPPVVVDRLSRGPLEYDAVWKVAQRMTDKPVKFGCISAQCLAGMMWNEHYASDRALILDLADVLNEELRALAAAGCSLIQIEEPRHHWQTLGGPPVEEELEFFTEAFNREVRGVEAEIWCHTCWGNPSQQRFSWEPPSYAAALPYLLELDCDVITFECASSNGRDLPLFAEHDHGQEDRRWRGQSHEHRGRTTGARRPARAARSRVHSAGAAGGVFRLRVRPRRVVSAHCILQVGVPGDGNESRAPRARPAGGAGARHGPAVRVLRSRRGRTRLTLSPQWRPGDFPAPRRRRHARFAQRELPHLSGRGLLAAGVRALNGQFVDDRHLSRPTSRWRRSRRLRRSARCSGASSLARPPEP